MRYRTIALAALSTALGIALVEAPPALSAFGVARVEEAPRSLSEVPPSSVEVEVERLVRTDGGPVVLLRPKGRDTYLPIWVGHAEGRAIARAGLDTVRPMTHDLLATMIAELDAEVLHVRVERLRSDGIYVGSVTVRRDGEIMTLDSRPSDAIALALRVNAPIYLAETLSNQMVSGAVLD